MNYEIHPREDVLVVELRGHTWGNLEDLQLKAEITAALGMGRRRFIFDFREVDSVTSMGLGTVVACWAAVRQARGTMLVCGANPRVLSVFEVAGVHEVLPVLPDRARALAELGIGDTG